MLNGEVQGVIRGLRRMATLQEVPKEKRAVVASACGYFTAHAHPMKYDEYLAAGLLIATGVIEGASRHLVQDRLEPSGMCWSTDETQAMLSLRPLKASNAWDEFLKHFLNSSQSLRTASAVTLLSSFIAHYPQRSHLLRALTYVVTNPKIYRSGS